MEAQKPGSLVFAPNAFRRDQKWPAVVLAPEQAPAWLKHLQSPGKTCVMFYGPSVAQVRVRDYYWLPTEALQPWSSSTGSGGGSSLDVAPGSSNHEQQASVQALSIEAGYLNRFHGAMPQLCQRVWFDWELDAGLLACCTRCGHQVHGACDDRAALHLKARDCYMFHATEDRVIDNTGGGNYARFTNHCCSPCLYAKVLELGGFIHLCFFARCDIKVGQELTYDYRFKEEDSDCKVICQCGAPNCKGTLN
eukprot:gene12769-12897_t